MRDDAVLGRALPLDRGLGLADAWYCDVIKDGAGNADNPQMTSKAAVTVFRRMPSRSPRIVHGT